MNADDGLTIHRTTMKWGAWSGVAAAVVFVGTFTIEGWLRPNYHPLSEYVSALSLGPRGWVQITSFVVTGALLLCFAAHVRSMLLAIVGCGILLSGPFVMDPMGTPPTAMTFHGMAHQLLGAIVFAMMPVTTFVFLRRPSLLRERMRRWTFAAGIIMVAAIVALKIAQLGLPPHQPNTLTPWIGLVQRTVLVTFFAWLFALAR